MIKKSDVASIGKIRKAHGLKGEVVFEFTDDIFDRADCDFLFCEVEGILVPFFIEEYRFMTDSSALMKFEDIDSEEETRQIVGCEVFVPRSVIVESADAVSLGFFIGYEVKDNGNVIGKIVDVDDNTQNWLFSIQTPDDENILVPANEELITDIDHDGRFIDMQLPEGLLDINK